jgi:hypothetical protein
MRRQACCRPLVPLVRHDPAPAPADCYNEQVEARGQGVMLTEGQREWVKAQLHLLRDLPEPKAAAPSHPMRRRLYAFITVRSTAATVLLL